MSVLSEVGVELGLCTDECPETINQLMTDYVSFTNTVKRRGTRGGRRWAKVQIRFFHCTDGYY